MVLLTLPSKPEPAIEDVFPQILCILPNKLVAMHKETARTTGVIITVLAQGIKGKDTVPSPLGKVRLKEGYTLFSMMGTVPMARPTPQAPKLLVVKRF